MSARGGAFSGGSSGEPGGIDAAAARRETQIGLAAAVGAYALWGLMVVFFKWLGEISIWEIIAHRIIWTIVFVGIFLAISGRLGEVASTLAQPRVRRALVISALLIGANWTIYVWAVDSKQVLQASFGYFINPLVNVLVGFLLLGERLSRWQAMAVALAAVAVALQAMMLSDFPWISLALAGSFAAYGYVRKLTPVGASSGLFIETLVLLAPALVLVGYFMLSDTGHFLAAPLPTIQLLLTGVATALPLILFALGARRLKLSTIGLVQYLAPSIQFLLAVFVYGEAMTSLRLATFVLIWISLLIYTTDSLRHRPTPPT